MFRKIDVSGGDKIPRKGGPGITQSDLLVINKTDLAEIVGADLDVMDRDSRRMRFVHTLISMQNQSRIIPLKLLINMSTNARFTSSEGGPTIFAQVKHGKGVPEIVDLILSSWRASGASGPSL